MNDTNRRAILDCATIKDAETWEKTQDKACFVAEFLCFLTIDNPRFEYWENEAEKTFLAILKANQ